MKRFFLACLLMLGAAPASATTLLTFSSAQGEWVGQGQTRTYTPSNASMVFSSDRNMVQVQVQGNDGKWWMLDLAAPVGTQLAPGKYLEAVTRVTGRSSGLYFGGDGRSCDGHGQFTIRQIAFDNAGQLSKLEATATQFCGGNPLSVVVMYRAPYHSLSLIAPTTDHYVVQRLKRSYYNDTSLMTVQAYAPNHFLYRVSGQGDEWNFQIAAPAGQARFQKGSSFDTTRFGGDANGALDVWGDGRGCNEAAGTMTILDVVYGPEDRMDRFYADFTHYCGGRAGVPLTGRIRWNRGT